MPSKSISRSADIETSNSITFFFQPAAMAFGSITTKDVMSLLIQSAFTAVFRSQQGSGTTVWEVRSKQDSTVGKDFEGHREYFVNYSSFGNVLVGLMRMYSNESKVLVLALAAWGRSNHMIAGRCLQGPD
ncbi:hypothetical protein CDAR_201191 [Caerostris darwini]|uniref:Uncharacterized protein n=1 Tax=Caerostris darwini TaxID=1538125 RepID=A0AAV4P8Q6_9ARAC|nr:hypothetical protein CDAR_201191 [Caerostris darwini]